MFKKLDKVLDSFLEIGIPSYDCMIMKDGKAVYRRMDGYSDYEKTVRIKGDERYNIYSCSKPITCVAALQLLEQGKYKLSDKLSDYLPEFKNMTVNCSGEIKPAEKPILIKDLFTMTSGFDYGLGWPVREKMRKATGGVCATREVVRELAKLPLLFTPGERWEYGLSHDILAAFVEAVSGERFGEYVKKNIFDPLSMTKTTFLLPKDELDSVCAQYDYNDATKKFRPCGKDVVDYKFGSLYESGGAGCVSTVEDYMKFLEAIRIGNIILKKETIDMMTTNMLTPKQAKSYWKSPAYGYGLGVRTAVEGKTFDFGWGGAAGAFLLVDRTHNITLFYAQHVLHSPNGALRDRLAEIVTEALTGKSFEKHATLPDEVLKKYL